MKITHIYFRKYLFFKKKINFKLFFLKKKSNIENNFFAPTEEEKFVFKTKLLVN